MERVSGGASVKVIFCHASAPRYLLNRLRASVTMSMARGPKPMSLRFRMRRRLHPMRLPKHMRPAGKNRPIH